METNLLFNHSSLTTFWKNLSDHILFLNQLSSGLISKTKELQNKSNEEIKKLIQFKEDLLKTYKELEELKNKIITFQNFEGKFQNLFCKNTQNQKEDICTKLLEEKEKKNN